jgi:hypothetical protein
VDDTRAMLHHCVKDTAEILSLLNRWFEFEKWEDTSDVGTRQLAIWTCFGELTPCSGQLAIHTFFMANRPWIGTDSITLNQ